MTAEKAKWSTAMRGCLIPILLMAMSLAAEAQPRVRMKMDLVSIRNRSAAPIPVRVRLEYNDPQYLEGALELQIYDALEMLSESDRIATIRREGIVLAGQDYEFQMLLPPLKTSSLRNWAVRAVFITENERIPLSSIADRINPAEPFDLLMTSSRERGFLLCSASDDPRNRTASVNRKLLEEKLLLQELLPTEETSDRNVAASAEVSGMPPGQKVPGNAAVTAVHHAGEWEISDLPEDPLGYCAFDVVLLSDGGLARMSEEQLRGLGIWLRAGGSLCVLAAEPLQGIHLQFLRTVLKQGLGIESDLTLDTDGRLLSIDDDPQRIVMSHYGLGRAVLLPNQEDLTELFSQREIVSRLVSFLWKVREDSPLRNADTADYFSDLSAVRVWLPEAKQDEFGIFLEQRPSMNYIEGLGYYGLTERDGRFYLDQQWVQSAYQGLQLSPQLDASLQQIENALLPSDVEMVPTAVISLILLGYVVMIGPVDYFVLGWLQMRKYTWFVFPVVTACFTFLTIAVAHSYMSSDATGSRLVVTDLDSDNTPVRQTTLESLFYNRQDAVTREHRRAISVQMNMSFSNNSYGQVVLPDDKPLTYQGIFPQAYTTVQEVQQWSPVMLRSMTLEPESVDLPKIAWDDISPTTPEVSWAGVEAALRQMSSESEGQYAAYVVHRGVVRRLYNTQVMNGVQGMDWTSGGRIPDSELALMIMIESLPTQNTSSKGILGMLSQLSPQGATFPEDLAMSDGTNPREHVLVVVRIRQGLIEVFRRRYFLEAGVDGNQAVPGME